MIKNSKREVEYRLAKWVIRNLEVKQLLAPDEIRLIWQGLIDYYDPPTRSAENISGTIGGDQNG